MGLGSHLSLSKRWCYSTENYNEFTNKTYHNTDDETIISKWVFVPDCDDCKENRDFTNNVCSYQPMHKVSLSWNICGKVFLNYYCSYQ